MDKCIKLYKRISMLSLFLFMFGILLINICIIGFSVGSNNIAFAMDPVTGYYQSNMVSIGDCLAWDYNLSGDIPNGFYSDDYFLYQLRGSGARLVDNVFSCSSGTAYLRIVFSVSNLPNTTYYAVVGYVSNNGASIYQNADNVRYFNNNATYNYQYQSRTITPMIGYSYEIALEENESITLRYIAVYQASSFYGYVPNSYLPNGYDVGYTDGVNSASGGISPDITNLTGMVWVVPDSLTVVPDDYYTYHVSGTVKHTVNNRDVITDFDSIQLYPTSSLSGTYSALVFYDSNDSEMELMARPDFVVTFTGGTDIDDSDLISWLSSNNQFLTYTDGYNDGYDIGYDLGYQEGLHYSDYQHGFDDGYDIGVNVGSQFLFSGYHLIDGNYTSGYVTTEFIADGKKYRGTLTRSSGQTNYLDDSVGTSSLIADGVYYAAYKIGSFIDGFAFSTYVGANAYPNDDVNTNLVYFYVIMVDPLNETYIKVRLVDYSIILNRLRKNLTDYNNYYFKYIFPTSNSYDCYLVYDGYYNNTSIGQYLSAYQLQNFMTYNYDPNTVSDEYNTGVTVGYNEGYLQGNEEGYNSGYADYQAYGEQNYDLGYYNGHMIGYQEGLTNGSTNEYGFHTLLGAVFDVPVQTINGLLDFEILGVNMKGFYLGLISLCIALFILKIVFK